MFCRSARLQDGKIIDVRSYERDGGTSSDSAAAGKWLSDEDFKLAIHSLEASTASIETQCRRIEAHKEVLQEVHGRNGSDRDREDTNAQRANKLQREKALHDFEAAELIESLRSRLEATTTQIGGATNVIQSSADRVLERDDRLLDGLENVLPHLLPTDNGMNQSEDIERLCQALVLYSSAEIQSRIDAAYLTAAYSYGGRTNGVHSRDGSHETLHQRDSLRLELEELCREIDGLSTMVVANQYRTPIFKAVQTGQLDADANRSTWSEYVHSTLQYLVARLDLMIGHFQHVRAHNAALQTIGAAVQDVLASDADRTQSPMTGTKSPTKASQRGLKPLRLVQANLSESHDPASQLLRYLDIRVPDSGDSTKLVETLASALDDKKRKLNSLGTNSGRGVSDQIARSLADVDMDSQALLGAVFVHSTYGKINAVDRDLQAGIDQLQADTQKTGDEMRQTDIDELARVIRRRQNALLHR